MWSGLSILSGSHVSLVREVVQRLREAGLGDVPVVVGGIIPPDDVNILKQCGASAVYTPKDFQLNDIMAGIVQLVDAKAEALVRAERAGAAARERGKRCRCNSRFTLLQAMAAARRFAAKTWPDSRATAVAARSRSRGNQ